MKIAHVLTYVSADGAYGGPLAVMVGHCQELAARGHDVEVFAGWDGRARLEIPGVTVHLFRARRLVPRSFAGLVAPALLAALARRRDFDVVHVHLARDLVVVPAALVALARSRRARVFVQAHGMIKPDGRALARAMDVGVRSILDRCTSVLALTAVDAGRIAEVAGHPVPVAELPNGITLGAEDHVPHDGSVEFLFLARLQPRKRVLVFAEAARRALAEGVSARFPVVGPDEGDLAPLLEFVRAHGLEDAVVHEGAVAPGTGPQRLRRADVYVLPSRSEPFPITVLEAMSVGVPCIVSEDCHVAGPLVRGGGVVTFDGEAADLARVMVELAGDPRRRVELGAAARHSAATTFSVAAVVDRLERLYRGERSAADVGAAAVSGEAAA